MKENSKNSVTGRTWVDLIFERPLTALLILFLIFGCIFLLGRAGISVEIPDIIKTSTPEQQEPETSTTSSVREESLPVSPNITPTVSPSKPLIEEKETRKKIIVGSLDFQTPPSSEYYFIKIRGKGDFQRVEKSGGFQLAVDHEETDIHLDVFNEAKEKLTSVNFDCSKSYEIQIRIK